MITLVSPIEGKKVSTLPDVVRKFLLDEEGRASQTSDSMFRQAFAKRENSLPKAVIFRWEDDGEYGEGNYILIISQNSDLSEPVALITEKKQAKVYNLFVGTHYYWCVQKEGRRSEVGEFVTRDGYPRLIHIDGISNVRDIGGIKVKGGKIKQGMVYRGGEFDTHMHITAKGMRELMDLGIKTDIDMRGESVGKIEYGVGEPFGVRRVLIPTSGYNIGRDYKGYIDILKMLADESVYPVYQHCWGGADRGGTLSMLIEAICGAEDKALIDDYELTTLSIWGRRTRNYGEFANMLDMFRGYGAAGDNGNESLSVGIVKFLVGHGMTEGELEKIRQNLVEYTDNRI